MGFGIGMTGALDAMSALYPYLRKRQMPNQPGVPGFPQPEASAGQIGGNTDAMGRLTGDPYMKPATGTPPPDANAIPPTPFPVPPGPNDVAPTGIVYGPGALQQMQPMPAAPAPQAQLAQQPQQAQQPMGISLQQLPTGGFSITLPSTPPPSVSAQGQAAVKGEAQRAKTASFALAQLQAQATNPFASLANQAVMAQASAAAQKEANMLGGQVLGDFAGRGMASPGDSTFLSSALAQVAATAGQRVNDTRTELLKTSEGQKIDALNAMANFIPSPADTLGAMGQAEGRAQEASMAATQASLEAQAQQAGLTQRDLESQRQTALGAAGLGETTRSNVAKEGLAAEQVAQGAAEFQANFGLELQKVLDTEEQFYVAMGIKREEFMQMDDTKRMEMFMQWQLGNADRLTREQVAIMQNVTQNRGIDADIYGKGLDYTARMTGIRVGAETDIYKANQNADLTREGIASNEKIAAARNATDLLATDKQNENRLLLQEMENQALLISTGMREQGQLGVAQLNAKKDIAVKQIDTATKLADQYHRAALEMGKEKLVSFANAQNAKLVDANGALTDAGKKAGLIRMMDENGNPTPDYWRGGPTTLGEYQSLRKLAQEYRDSAANLSGIVGQAGGAAPQQGAQAPQALLSYIQTNMQNLTNDQIRQAAKNKGWSDQQIDAALQAAGRP
jgi:hypothetical protein